MIPLHAIIGSAAGGGSSAAGFSSAVTQEPRCRTTPVRHVLQVVVKHRESNLREDRKDNGCFLFDPEVLLQPSALVLMGAERSNDQTTEKFRQGRWWMTYGSSGESGSTE